MGITLEQASIRQCTQSREQAPYAAWMRNPDELIPRSKSDLARAKAAEAAGYPAVAPVMAELVEWLQDGNWPVAHVLGPFLRGVGAVPELVRSVSDVLDSDDDIWKYWVLEAVVSGWEPTGLGLLQVQLTRIALRPTPNESAEEVDQAARELLARMNNQA